MSLRVEKSCGAVIIKDGKVLLAKQKNGIYSFPKGHVEKNETEIETAVRETREETGLNVVASQNWRFTLHYIVDGINTDKEVVLFLAKILGSEDFLRQEEEIETIEWVDFDDVNNYFHRSAWQKVWSEIRPIAQKIS